MEQFMLKSKLKIRIPTYTLKEEVINSITHGIGAIFGIVALVLMIIKAKTPLSVVTSVLFGVTMILLYTMSCLYHALSSHVEGKKVLRVIDHANVFLLVFGTYLPISLVGVGGRLGWILFGFVTFTTIIGIILTSIKIDQFQVVEVICHLLNGWSIVLGIPILLKNMGSSGVFYLVLGGIMYTMGSVFYAVGSKKKYIHSVFHVFCLLGTFFHFWAIYMYLL